METSDIQRTFILGDEWVFLKIYTGVKTADDILVNQISPLMNKWLEKNHISRWFFIRYYDPKSHIRVRFHLTDTKYIGELIKDFNVVFTTLIHQNLVWRLQSDVYVRELERYGANRIDDAETIFFHDSNMIIQTLKILEDIENQNYRWLTGLLMIDDIFDSFGLSIEEKKEMTGIFVSFFKNEFIYDSNLKKRLSLKYRNNKEDIEAILSRNEKHKEIINIIVDKSEKIKFYVEKIKSSMESKEISFNLIFSFCHMTLNRLYRTESRKNEFASYDLLLYYYKSAIARQKYSKK
ncbi:MAG: thiopeptide-type bacteriocin biosynthesis protein [Flavobacteriales bacterium]|nr:thiopeptide-type bacteriocin biosynthesis protein [Flavobacteriales bacterium]